MCWASSSVLTHDIVGPLVASPLRAFGVSILPDPLLQELFGFNVAWTVASSK